jgi:hypothetical protein
VNRTGGLRFSLNRAVLSGAVCVSVVGLKPRAVEALTFLNFHL